MTSSNQNDARRRGCLAAVIAIVVATILFRIWGLHTTSLDFDECYELNHRSLDLATVAKDADGFPPLYRWVLSYFSLCFGDGRVRELSVVLGMLSVFAIIWLTSTSVQACLGTDEAAWTGLRAGLFAAVSSHQVLFSQQARAYSLYILLAALYLIVTIHLQRHQSMMNWSFFLAVGCLGFATHYFFAILIIQAWVWTAVKLGVAHVKSLVIAGVLFTLLCIPVLTCLMIDLRNPLPEEAINRVDVTGFLYSGFTLFSGWTLGPSQIALQSTPFSQSVMQLLPWVLIIAACVLILFARGLQSCCRDVVSFYVGLLVLTPLMAVGIVLLFDSSFAARYIAWLTVPLAVTLGICSRFREISLRGLASWTLIAVSLIANWNRNFDDAYQRDNAYLLKSWLHSNYPDTPVLVLSHYFAESIRRVLDESSKVSSMPEDSRLEPESCTTISIGIKSDEPHDWDKQLPRFLNCLQRSKGDKDVLIIARWLPPTDPFHATRNKFLDPINAKRVTILSNNIEVFLGDRSQVERLATMK